MNSPATVCTFEMNEPSPCRAFRNDTPTFDRLARVYRWMEWLSFGPYLSRCRRAFLPQCRKARHALVLGDGEGRCTAALLRQNPHVLIDAVDASPAMVQALRRRAGTNRGRLQTEARDLREWSPKPGTTYDRIVTHFFLDCLSTDDVFSLARRVTTAATPDARWVVSEFAVPEGSFGRWIARPLVTLLYKAFGLLTGLRVRQLPDYSRALCASGFRLEQERTLLLGLLVAQVWRRTERQPAENAADALG